jgi:hypothetical protein
VTDVLQYLFDKGLNPRRASGDEVHVPCVFCNEDDRKRGRLYVNVTSDADIPGLHFCHLCGAKGSLVSLQRYFGDATEKQEREDTGYLRRAILAEAANYYHLCLGDNEDVLRWLKAERGLHYDTISAHLLGYADGGLFPHLRQLGHTLETIAATGLSTVDRETGRPVDFLRGHVTIPYLVAGNVVMIRGRAFGDADQGRKYVTPPGQKTRLFNSDATWETDELVITEGEFDCLVVEQLGYRAVACPGANIWQDVWDSYFANVRRVWVVFDQDARETGAKGAAKVLGHLGAKARLVELPPPEPPKTKNDLTEWIVVAGHSTEDFEALLRATRGMLLSVNDAILEHASLQGMNGIKFGLRKLDLLIEPGLLPGQILVFLSKTGGGKTIFLLNLLQWVCELQPDVKVLLLSLEQTRGDWWERARRIYRFGHPGSSDEDAAAFWRERLFMDDRNRISEDQLLALLEDFRYETGQKPLLAVDYLGYWAQSFKGERYERTADAIMALKAVAKDQRLVCIAPHQVNRMTMHGTEPALDSARDSGVVEETADFVMSLWSPDTVSGKTLEQRNGEFNLKVQKSRHGGTGLVEHFYLAPLSLAVVSANDIDRSRWARNELVYQVAYHEHWQQALIRHEAGTPPTEDRFDRVERALWGRRQTTTSPDWGRG